MKLIEDEETVRLLKACVPEPETIEPGPLKFTVPVLPLNVPLFVQLPLAVVVKELPLNVVEAPIFVIPPMFMFAAAVYVTDVPAPNVLLKLPSIDNAVPGKVFTAAPAELLNVRLPYV